MSSMSKSLPNIQSFPESKSITPVKSGKIESEEIEKIAVLPEMIGIGRIIHWSFSIPDKECKPGFDFFLEFFSPSCIYFAFKHIG